LWLIPLAIFAGETSAEEPFTVGGLKSPVSARVGSRGRVFVTQMGIVGKGGDGSVAVVDRQGRVTPFVTGLDDPRGMVAVGDFLFIADRTKLWRVGPNGRLDLFAGPDAFPRKPVALNDVAADGYGNLYVTDAGDGVGGLGAVFFVDRRGKIVQVLDGELTMPPVTSPGGVLVQDESHLIVTDRVEGYVFSYDLGTRCAQRIGLAVPGAEGLAIDRQGRLFIADSRRGGIYFYDNVFVVPTQVTDRFRSAADIAFAADGQTMLVPDTAAGTLTWFPIR
jgi:sugar lactone lactonase YvrE